MMGATARRWIVGEVGLVNGGDRERLRKLGERGLTGTGERGLVGTGDRERSTVGEGGRWDVLYPFKPLTLISRFAFLVKVPTTDRRMLESDDETDRFDTDALSELSISTAVRLKGFRDFRRSGLTSVGSVKPLRCVRGEETGTSSSAFSSIIVSATNPLEKVSSTGLSMMTGIL